MIHLRKNPFSDTSIEIPFTEGEKVSSLVDRVILTNGYELSPIMVKHFQVLVNGTRVEKDLWSYVELKETDTVLVAPILTRGDGGQLFKQIAGIVLVIAGAALLSTGIGGAAGLGLEGVGLALATATVAIGVTLALNALIPPPVLPGLGGLGSEGSSFEGSQMYTITSQANSVKKYGYVPKVYGTHRMFPIVAANPYTEIEADPDSGTLIQYFYAIYDFGLGPLDVSDIRLGDTSISDYDDVNYRFVDLNKPAVSEGLWDDKLYSSFTFYKGDVERDGTAVALNSNQSDPGVTLGDYQVVRNASPKVNGNNQEISLDFVCPAGLIAYATNGNTYTRNIDLTIEFSKIDENVWIPYNDLDNVYDFSCAGGNTVFSTKQSTVGPISNLGVGLGYSFLGLTNNFQWYYDPNEGVTDQEYVDDDNNPSTPPIKIVKSEIETYGYAVGAERILLGNGEASISDTLYANGNIIGVVASVESSVLGGYSWYNLKTPVTQSEVIFQIRKRYAQRIIGYDFFGNPIFQVYLYDGQYQGSQSQTDKVTVKFLSLGAARISANNSQQIYATFKFKPKQISQYKVRITRMGSSSEFSYQTLDKLTLASLSTRFDRNPINTTNRHVFLELRIKATNQISGSISNLSGLAESILDVYDADTSTWVKKKTNNPAWVFCDLVTGIVNKRAASKSRLHLPTILEWAAFCDEIPTSPPSQNFTQVRAQCNFVLDFDTTLQGVLNTITNAAHASLNIVDGKYGVLIDKLQTIPIQIFTPRNSWGFSSSRSYDDAPNGLKIQYVDPFQNWEVSEVLVFDDGFNEDNAVTFDELSTFACTNQEQAWRFGRYMLAQARLRKETISISVDFEYLVCTRGDFVQITQDVMRVGGRPARVKSVIGNRVKIDDGIDTLTGVDYAYVYRNPNEGIKTNTLTVVDSDEFDLDGDLPTVGDLIIIGEADKVVFDCIVKSITPSSDLTATLELVEKADGVYQAESTDTLPVYNPQLTLNVDSTLAIPPAIEDLIVTANTWRVVGGAYQYYIDLDWDVPIGAAYSQFEVYVDSGSGYNLTDFTQESFYEYIVNPANLNIPHNFKILAVSSTGKKLSLVDVPFVTATPLKKVTSPSDVDALYINITNQIIQLDWTSVADVDLKEYIIRYTPKTAGATWESSLPLLRADKNTTLASTQGRTGTYLIKALDLNNNESSVASIALTTIPNLFDLNIIEETDDFPDLEGQLVTVEKTSGALTIKQLVIGGAETNEYYSEGYYYYKNFLDLGDIFTVRLQSRIEAEGFTVGDLMSEWVTLDSVIAMSTSGQAQWDVETQYRTTDSYNVMSDWDTLSSVDPLSEGQQDNWTEWKKFIMGDATGRIFEFRLRLVSYAPHVTPRVFQGVIRADMSDRIEIYNNLIATGAGLDVVYSPAFKGPGSSPNIQITQDAASQGDYYVLENKTLAGFKITFYDKNNIAVTRQFDAAIKGYGRKALAVI